MATPMPPVLSYINTKLRETNLASRPTTAGTAAPHRPGTAASSASRRSATTTTTGYSRPTTANAIDLFKRRTRKGKAFLRDNEAADTILPQPLPDGIPVVASYTTFDELIERKILSQPSESQVHLTTEDVRIMYEAKCLDQNLKPTWEREVRFMELLTSNCKGTHFALKENGLGAVCAEAVGHVLSQNSHYAILDLSGNRLRDQGAGYVAQLLQTNTSLVHISLKSNDIGHVGGEAIAAALESNNTLTSLDLGGISGINRNHLGTRGAAAIGRVLRSNQVLAYLNLGSNGLGADGIAQLATGLENNTTLISIDLSSNNLGADGCRQLASVIESCAVETLHLQRNAIGDLGCKELCEALARCTEAGTETVARLYLEDNDIREVGAHSIATFTQSSYNLELLRLDNNPLGVGAKDVADALKDNRKLGELGLAACGLRVAEATSLAAALAHNRALTSLDLSGNRLHDAGVKAVADALRRNRTLLKLDLSSTGFALDGGRAVALMLTENTSLRDLNVRQNQMDNDAGSAIEDAMRVNAALQKLDYAFNDFSYRVCNSIAAALKRNSARWGREQVPRLEQQITALDEDQKELYRVQEEIEAERRAAKEKGDDLLRRKEANRSHAERFRQDLDVVREEEAEMAARVAHFESVFRAEDEKLNAMKEGSDRKITALNMRINNEREKRETIEREMDKLRKRMKQVKDAEEEALRPLREQFRRADNERQSDFSDAKWQSESLAATELKIKALEVQLGISTANTAKAPAPAAAAAGGKGGPRKK